MTRRLLLTLLALLTGLAAQSVPTDARLHSARAAEQSAVAGLGGEVRDHASVPLGLLPVSRARIPASAGSDAPLHVAWANAPAVFTGIDRARE